MGCLKENNLGHVVQWTKRITADWWLIHVPCGYRIKPIWWTESFQTKGYYPEFPVLKSSVLHIVVKLLPHVVKAMACDGNPCIRKLFLAQAAINSGNRTLTVHLQRSPVWNQVCFWAPNHRYLYTEIAWLWSSCFSKCNTLK